MKKLLISELDVLREFDGAGVVDGDGGAAHVALPGVRAALAAAARGLLAAERAAHLRAVGGDVHVHDAAVRPVRADPLQPILLRQSPIQVD